MATDSERMLISIQADLRDFSKKMNQMARESDKATRQVQANFARTSKAGAAMSQQLAASFSSLGGRFGGVGGALGVGAAAVGGLALLAKKVEQVAAKYDELADSAAKAGISAVELQRLSVATAQLGGNVEDLAGFLVRFNEALGEAQAGSGDLLKLFQANNVALKDANGEWRTTNDMLMEFSRLVRGGATRALQGEIANTVRGGRELVNVLGEGPETITAIGDAAEKAGIIVDEKLVAAAQNFNDRWTWASQQVAGTWDAAILHMAATANAMIDRISAALQGMPSPWALPPGQPSTSGPPWAPWLTRQLTPEERIKQGFEVAGTPLKLTIHPKPLTPTVIPSKGGGGGKAGGSGMTTITTKGGLKATVATPYADQFEGLLNELEERITIKGLSSLRPGATVAGTGRPSQHRYGKAIDVNPAENVSRWASGGFSDDELRAIAARWGMRWGGDFRKRDTMHFDVMGRAPLGQDELNTSKGISNELQTQLELRQQNYEVWRGILQASEQQGLQLQENTDTMEGMRSAAESAFGTILHGIKDGASAGEILASVLDDILNRLIDVVSKNLAGAMFPSGGGGLLGSLFGGGAVPGASLAAAPLGRFAEGGSPPVGVPSIVGEKGPELFVPKVPGTVVPHGRWAMPGLEANGHIKISTAPGLHAEMSAISLSQIGENNRRMPSYLSERRRRGT